MALRAGGRTFTSDPKPKPRPCLENIVINKPQNPRTKHVGTVFKRASSLVQEEFPAPMLENETKSEFQGVGENRAPFPSLPKGHCFPGVTPPPSAPFLLKHLHLARERRAPALRVVHGPPPAPASPALCTAEQSFTLLINQKLARKKVGQVNKDRLFFFFFALKQIIFLKIHLC